MSLIWILVAMEEQPKEMPSLKPPDRVVIVCCEVFLCLPRSHVDVAAVEEGIGDGRLTLSCVAIPVS